MSSTKQYKNSFWASAVVGAIGAFIFWGVFSGWFSGGEADTQIAAPAGAGAAIQEESH